MASSSTAGSKQGIERPDEIEVFEVKPDDDGFIAPHNRTTLVVMWHGNGYKRDDCWLQSGLDTVCDLKYWR
jgi:hypothetical protein